MAEQAAPEGRNRGLMTVRATLSAGGERSWDIPGDWVAVKTAPVDDLILNFDDGEPVPISQGEGLRRYYKKVTARSATGQTIVLRLGYGHSTDGRATANVSVTANVAPGNTFDDGGDVSIPNASATLLLAADPDRLYAKIALPSTAGGSIRIGTNAVGLASGDLVEPGMSVPVATTAAIYAYHEFGSAIVAVVSAVRQV